MSTTPDNNKDFEDIDALAGEYVLGTLSAAARLSVDERMRNEPALRDAVQAWEARLLPLAALAPPAEPSPALWARIERSLGPVQRLQPVPRRRRLQEARRPSRIGGTT
jgi:anti-sigma-K factor RskA